MVTCARTRGSMMKFLPVAALTASAICVMSASLKLGVMRCACCAEASDAAVSTASAHTANERSEEHTSELQSQSNLVCRLLLEKKKKKNHLENHLTNYR